MKFVKLPLWGSDRRQYIYINPDAVVTVREAGHSPPACYINGDHGNTIAGKAEDIVALLEGGEHEASH
jgi:hypothetical protein